MTDAQDISNERQMVIDELRGKIRTLEIRGEQRYLSDSGFWCQRQLVAIDDVLNQLKGTK